MLELSLRIAKSILKGILKFLISIHFLIVITFLFLKFLPGSYIEDEFIVVEKSQISENFFFELKKYLFKVYQFNLGSSYQSPKMTVQEIILSRYQSSLKILLVSFVTIVLIALLFSMLALLNKRLGKYLGYAINFLNTIPLLVLLPLIIYIMAFKLEFVPARYDSENIKCYLFAIFIISLKPLFQLTELIIQKWTSETKAQYNLTAKAKGLSLFQIYARHSFRNIVPSVINFSQATFLTLISGNFLVESFYSIPGVGLSFVEAMSNRDLPLILGCVIFLGTIYFVVNSISEIFILFLQVENRKSL